VLISCNILDFMLDVMLRFSYLYPIVKEQLSVTAQLHVFPQSSEMFISVVVKLRCQLMI